MFIYSSVVFHKCPVSFLEPANSLMKLEKCTVSLVPCCGPLGTGVRGGGGTLAENDTVSANPFASSLSGCLV